MKKAVLTLVFGLSISGLAQAGDRCSIMPSKDGSIYAEVVCDIASDIITGKTMHEASIILQNAGYKLDPSSLQSLMILTRESAKPAQDNECHTGLKNQSETAPASRAQVDLSAPVTQPSAHYEDPRNTDPMDTSRKNSRTQPSGEIADPSDRSAKTESYRGQGASGSHRYDRE